MDANRRSLAEDSTDIRPSKICRVSSPQLLGKVCLICSCAPKRDQSGEFSFVDENVDHCLYLFDLDDVASADDGPYMPKNPHLCFSSVDLNVDGFCVLGTTLYLFGKKEKAVYSYSLSSIPPTSSPTPVMKLVKDDLTEATPMKFHKYRPVGCQTPDGKMVVLSSALHVGRPAENYRGAFELFDPVEGRWTELPDLRPLLRGVFVAGNCASDLTPFPQALTYSFIDNSSLLLISTELGNFTLDLNDWNRGWVQCFRYTCPRPAEELYFLARDRFCLADWFAWEDGAGTRDFLSYPELPLMPSDDYFCSPGIGITWLTSSLLACTVRIRVDNISGCPHLVIDLYDFSEEDELQRGNVETAEGLLPLLVKVTKRFSFLMGPQHIGRWFTSAGLFSIPPL